MLDRYRVRSSAPAAPEAAKAAGAKDAASLLVAPAAPAAPAGVGDARAVDALETSAEARGIDGLATLAGSCACDTDGEPLKPLVTCGDCIHFTPNQMNPMAGVGVCVLGEPDMGGWPYYPGACRCCDRHVAVADF